MNPGYLTLGVAILCELVGTLALQLSAQFTRVIPSLVTLVAYGAAFYFLSLSLRSIPLGIAYAMWSGVGIVGITLLGLAFLRQIPDLPAVLGIALIIAGVLVIHLFSRSTA